MFEINYNNLDKEIKIKRKSIIVTIVTMIVLGTVMYFSYFYISEKNDLVGKICLGIIAVLVVDFIFSIIRFISIKKYKKNAKYLEKNGVLLNDQNVLIESGIISFNFKPCIYYIAPNDKLYKLRAKSVINLMSKGTVDILIDINNPKRYYMDSNIKTTKEFDKEKNYSHFSDKKYYPNYINQINNRKNFITNIFAFLVLSGVAFYLAFVKETSMVKVAALLVSLFSLVNIFVLIKRIIDTNKYIKKIKRVSDKGTLVKNIPYEKPKDKLVKEFSPIIKYNEKTYKGCPIIYNSQKDKIDMLTYKKECIINYDIKTYRDYYRN